jgi:hypothetical protein
MRRWIVRHEHIGDDIFALWQDENGDRWHVQVVIKDITERLRSLDLGWVDTGEWFEEAANKIEQLRKDRDRLRDALLLTLPFVKKDGEIEAVVHAALMEGE